MINAKKGTMRELKIGPRTINDESDCFVIAEIGHNHQGSVETAMKIIAEAKKVGADAVKFQKRNNKELYTKAMYDSAYNNDNSYGETYGAHREALELGWEDYVKLKEFAEGLDLIFFATAFDFSSVDFLEKLGVPLYKLASGDLKNLPLISYIARTGKPALLSTGGGRMEDVERAYELFTKENKDLAVLQCTATYPCEPEEMNLNVITTFRDKFPQTVIGLSDHQSGIGMALVAFTLGARIIEKHFTLNRAWKGSDHAFSLAPVGFSKLVRDLRRVRLALGSFEKQPNAREEQYLFKMGKKLVAACDLKKGDVLSEVNIAIKSPADGLPPYELPNFIGRPLKRDLKLDENIRYEDI